jgi:hypothetical protein
MWPSPPLLFCPHRLFVVVTAACPFRPLFSHASSQRARSAGGTRCIQTPFSDSMPGEDSPGRGALVGNAVLGWSSLSEELPRNCAVERGLQRCGWGENEWGCGIMRRRRGRRLLMVRLLLLFGRLLRCFLRCHEYSTSLQFHQWDCIWGI